MTPRKQRPPIVAKWVPIDAGPCGVCGAEVPDDIGPRLVVEGTTEPVCASCGAKHAPDLAQLVALAVKRVRARGRLAR
jgi:hypothetical protein